MKKLLKFIKSLSRLPSRKKKKKKDDPSIYPMF